MSLETEHQGDVSELHLRYNGWWSKLTLTIVAGVATAVVLGGLGGILVTIRQLDANAMNWRTADLRFNAHLETDRDHEARLRQLEMQLSKIDSGLSILLERTRPDVPDRKQ